MDVGDIVVVKTKGGKVVITVGIKVSSLPVVGMDVLLLLLIPFVGVDIIGMDVGVLVLLLFMMGIFVGIIVDTVMDGVSVGDAVLIVDTDVATEVGTVVGVVVVLSLRVLKWPATCAHVVALIKGIVIVAAEDEDDGNTPGVDRFILVMVQIPSTIHLVYPDTRT